MEAKTLRSWSSRDVWDLARRQHWVVTRGQLLELGMGSKAIRHRLRSGRLHRVMRGVYVVGRREIDEETSGLVDIVVPDHIVRRRPGIRLHPRAGLASSPPWSQRWPAHGIVDEIPVTGPVPTLVDLAMCLLPVELEAAVNEASQLDLIDPESLREALDAIPPRPGIARLRRLLDRDTFVLTETRLEQLFLPIARAAGLPLPQTQVWLGDYRVDFYWPELGLIVEADSLRFHRTPSKQARDNRRDQAHIAAGRMPLLEGGPT